jgi:hypothetical protein
MFYLQGGQFVEGKGVWQRGVIFIALSTIPLKWKEEKMIFAKEEMVERET